MNFYKFVIKNGGFAICSCSSFGFHKLMCLYKEEVHILVLWVNVENETKHKIISWVENVEFSTRNILSETIGFNVCLLVMS
jgi:hypothetical protein